MDILNIAQIFEKAMDAASLRQQVIANNIANVNTPNFRPATVAFEDQLKAAVAAQEDDEFQVVADFSDSDLGIAGTATDLKSVQPAIEQSGTKVDINQEMVNLAKNQIIYNALAAQAGGRFGGFKYIIENYGR